MAYDHTLRYGAWREQFMPAATKYANTKVLHTSVTKVGMKKWTDKAGHAWTRVFCDTMERLVDKHYYKRSNMTITADEYREYMQLKREVELREVA